MRRRKKLWGREWFRILKVNIVPTWKSVTSNEKRNVEGRDMIIYDRSGQMAITAKSVGPFSIGLFSILEIFRFVKIKYS